MLNPQRQLTELVRLLQERGYIFAADPESITKSLRYAAGEPEAKLIQRAQMIDSDHKLSDGLMRVRSSTHSLAWIITVFWLILGFSGTFTLMQQSGLNFFFVLASVLGLHTFMLILWLILVCMPKFKSIGVFSSPVMWIRGKDPISQAILRLYSDEWHRPSTRWLISRASHRFWLASLSGMLTAVLLLLMVRQYTFTWESTMLSDEAFVQIVNIMAWLPAKLGFATPNAEAVLHSRLSGDMAVASRWGGLLIGSIVCYGLLPRFIAWSVSALLSRQQTSRLPLNQPYYQNIIQQWQRRVVDEDTHTETVPTVSPKIQLVDGDKWAVMLDSQWPDETWFQYILGQQWLNQGVADSRDAVAELMARLQQTPVQLLIGVRAGSVPDRGVLRQITQLAEAAQGGAVVQLLAEKKASDGIQDYLIQWHEALSVRQLAWLDPPRISQQARIQ